MAFVKLDCGMVNSTIWMDREAREIFITALLMAEPKEFLEPQKQLQVKNLDETGFEVPSGWYGFVPAAGTGIVRMAGLDNEHGLAALERLGDLDLESRSPDYGGRRLIRVDGGYLVLNYVKYREKDATSADRSKRWRDRQKQNRHTVADTATRCDRHAGDTIAEVEVEADSKNSISANAETGGGSDSDLFGQPTDLSSKTKTLEARALEVVRGAFDYYRTKSGKSAMYTLTKERLKKGVARYKHALVLAKKSDPGARRLMKLAIDALAASDFHMGRENGGKEYNSWDKHLFRSDEQFEEWLEKAGWAA